MSDQIQNELPAVNDHLRAAVKETLQDGEKILYSCMCDQKPFFVRNLLYIIGTFLIFYICLYVYNTYTGNDYYQLLATIKQAKIHPEAVFQVAIVFIAIGYLLWSLAKDDELLMVTNKRVLYFRRELGLSSVLNRKPTYIVFRLDLADIVNVKIGNRSLRHLEVTSNNFFRRINVFGVPDPQEAIEQIRKAAKLET